MLLNDSLLQSPERMLEVCLRVCKCVFVWVKERGLQPDPTWAFITMETDGFRRTNVFDECVCFKTITFHKKLNRQHFFLKGEILSHTVADIVQHYWLPWSPPAPAFKIIVCNKAT